jgi:excisionase family DNA binding protein
MNRYSTREAAKKLGLHLATLQRYLAEDKIPAPPIQDVVGNKFRVWTEKDLDLVRKILPKIANGRKTRYQKLREKQKTQAGVPVPHKKRKSSKKK